MAERDGGGTPGTVLAVARSLLLPGVLAITAGFVDAVAFLHLFGVFPANQSGNLVLLGMAFASAVPPSAWVSATSIVGFTVGTAGGAWVGGRVPSTSRRSILLGAELALLVALAIASATIDRTDALLTGARLGALLLVASVAMGIQTEVIRQVAGVAVTTTYETGTMARIGESIAGPTRGLGERGAATVVVLGAMVACYVGGAALGATELGEGRAGLVVPCITVAIVLLLSLVSLIGASIVAARPSGRGEPTR